MPKKDAPIACGNIQVKTLEKFTEQTLDLTKIADYLGWIVRKEEDGNHRIVSRKRIPRVEVETLKSHEGCVFIWTIVPKGMASHCVVVASVKEVIFETYQRIELGVVLKEVREVSIVYENGSAACLKDESPRGFNVFIGAFHS